MKNKYDSPVIFVGDIIYTDVIAASSNIDDFGDNKVKYDEVAL